MLWGSVCSAEDASATVCFGDADVRWVYVAGGYDSAYSGAA